MKWLLYLEQIYSHFRYIETRYSIDERWIWRTLWEERILYLDDSRLMKVRCVYIVLSIVVSADVCFVSRQTYSSWTAWVMICVNWIIKPIIDEQTSINEYFFILQQFLLLLFIFLIERYNYCKGDKSIVFSMFEVIDGENDLHNYW